MVAVLVNWFKEDYRVISESLFPKDDIYYWTQERKYKKETKVMKWKRPIIIDSLTRNIIETPWELDTMFNLED